MSLKIVNHRCSPGTRHSHQNGLSSRPGAPAPVLGTNPAVTGRCRGPEGWGQGLRWLGRTNQESFYSWRGSRLVASASCCSVDWLRVAPGQGASLAEQWGLFLRSDFQWTCTPLSLLNESLSTEQWTPWAGPEAWRPGLFLWLCHHLGGVGRLDGQIFTDLHAFRQTLLC